MHKAMQNNGYDLLNELITPDFVFYIVPVVFFSLIPVFGYTKLVNWLADPYKKPKNCPIE